MKQFFKFVLASCLGVALSIIALGFIGFVILMGIASSSSEQQVKLSPNSVLHLTFGKPIPEQTNNLSMPVFDLSNQKILGLNDIVKTIEHAATDNKIKGIFINPEHGLGTGLATASSLRKAILKFKESGKFVVAYSKYYTQGAYYISSAADKVYVNPMGGVDFYGLSAIIPFFKEMLDKIGVKMQIYYAGDFKGATEPYRLTKMSDANRLQLREYIGPVFTDFLSAIGESRKKTTEELRQVANGLKSKDAEAAVNIGLADATAYNDDVIADLKERLGLKEKDKLNLVSLEDYANSYRKDKDYSAKDKIALLYAEGPIYPNEGEKGTIVDDKYIKTIRKIRNDDKFKAIVFRVNSPGGSALASENILRELTLAQKAGKKVVVSMGDYAASGGYYISCMADKILAEPNTLTGSIGVFSMIPNVHQLFDEKLGINFDSVKTAPYSTGINNIFELSPEEDQLMTESTISIYERFLSRVSEGRRMSRDNVHQIAQGRVWTGTKAKELGLVDEIGGLDQAIEMAASLANIEKYRIAEYPFQKEPLQELIEELTGQGGDDEGIETHLLQKELGSYYSYYKHVKEMLNMRGIQMRLPVVINFN